MLSGYSVLLTGSARERLFPIRTVRWIGIFRSQKIINQETVSYGLQLEHNTECVSIWNSIDNYQEYSYLIFDGAAYSNFLHAPNPPIAAFSPVKYFAVKINIKMVGAR